MVICFSWQFNRSTAASGADVCTHRPPHSINCSIFALVLRMRLLLLHFSFCLSANDDTTKCVTFIQAISIAPLEFHYYSEVLSTQHGYCIGVSSRAPQATASEVLSQVPCVAARARFEPTTIRTKGVESTNEPPHPTRRSHSGYIHNNYMYMYV